ncbi:hypothetical protein ACTOB_001762 [Actinoplanes oblitus]|uniref:Uncharacterized protein n=1 Tax=Actinoplanes oblitus TaxID=3040509 RepID=A0ABY8WM59_9ACTN|nr:hypothetical protein [Actinoplanes oblitus]WIM98178.1 hypothetical protein ACTOB_001762 [Actinoplanes oblitus]
MATDQSPQAAGFAEVSRTLVAIAAEVVTGVQRAVVGPGNVRTARDNAWSAIQADRARAAARAETSRAVAAMAASSPRRTVAAARRRARGAVLPVR